MHTKREFLGNENKFACQFILENWKFQYFFKNWFNFDIFQLDLFFISPQKLLVGENRLNKKSLNMNFLALK